MTEEQQEQITTLMCKAINSALSERHAALSLLSELALDAPATADPLVAALAPDTPEPKPVEVPVEVPMRLSGVVTGWQVVAKLGCRWVCSPAMYWNTKAAARSQGNLWIEDLSRQLGLPLKAAWAEAEAAEAAEVSE